MSSALPKQQMPNNLVRLTRGHASFAPQSGYGETLVSAASRPPAIAGVSGSHQLKEIQGEVLKQLCISDSDVAIAGKVAISPLTPRHLMAELNHELDGNHRHDVAVGAFERGWMEVE